MDDDLLLNLSLTQCLANFDIIGTACVWYIEINQRLLLFVLVLSSCDDDDNDYLVVIYIVSVSFKYSFSSPFYFQSTRRGEDSTGNSKSTFTHTKHTEKIK